jgi:hypothetical protein
MFRNRDRMIRVLGVIMAIALLLAFTLPFLAAGR